MRKLDLGTVDWSDPRQTAAIDRQLAVFEWADRLDRLGGALRDYLLRAVFALLGGMGLMLALSACAETTHAPTAEEIVCSDQTASSAKGGYGACVTWYAGLRHEDTDDLCFKAASEHECARILRQLEKEGFKP